MMTEKRYIVESKVNELMNDFADEHELERNFYGDCYPDEVRDLLNLMEKMSVEELEEALEELKADLKAWYL